MSEKIVVEIAFRTEVDPDDFDQEDYPLPFMVDHNKFVCEAIKYDILNGATTLEDYAYDINEGNLKVTVSA
jgi:hypothetical protein